jgi:dihydroorotate dehydrogenase
MTGQDAYEFIRARASAVQIYTALIHGDPFVPILINNERRPESLQLMLPRQLTPDASPV